MGPINTFSKRIDRLLEYNKGSATASQVSNETLRSRIEMTLVLPYGCMDIRSIKLWR